MKPNRTSFQKGNRPTTAFPVGTIRRRKRHTKDYVPRYFIKIAEPKTWLEYPRYLWIKHYGFLRKGDIVRHIDGDTLNVDIENLIAIPRSVNADLNRWGKKRITFALIQFCMKRYVKNGHQNATQTNRT